MTKPVAISRRGNRSPSFLFFAGGLLAALILTPCRAASQTPERVIFHPGWFTSAQFAGIFVALDEGFYREAGLDVTIEPFAYGQNGPAAIDAQPDICGLGSIEGYILLQKRNVGTDLKALAAMLQESPAGYMVLGTSKIHDAGDFAGQRIGVHKFADAIFRWFCQNAGVAPGKTNMSFVGDDVTLLTRGTIDAMQGYATEEFVRLQDLTGGSSRFVSFASLGFSSYSEIIYTTSAQSSHHEQALRQFVAATRRGWSYAFSHPEKAAAAVSSRMKGGSDRTYLNKALAALRPYVCPGGQDPLRAMDRAKWQRTQQVAAEIGLVSRVEPEENFLLNW